MRSQWMRLLVFTFVPLAWGLNEVHADWWPYTETVYTDSTSAVFASPTSYSATAYYADTYAWTPTAYYQSSNPVTGYYYQERVARRPLFSRPLSGLFGRRRDYVVPTTIYYPTTTVIPTTARYYAQTSLDYPVLSEVAYVGTSNACGSCDSMVVTASAPPASIERRIVREEESAPRIDTPPVRQTPVESATNEDRSTVDSSVSPAPDPEPGTLDPVGGSKPGAMQADGAATREVPKNNGSPPLAPAASQTNSQPPLRDTIRNSAPLQSDQSKTGAASGTLPGTAEKKGQTGPVDPQKKTVLPDVVSPGTQKPGGAGDPVDPPLPDAPVAPGSDFIPPAVDEKATPKTRGSMKPSSYSSLSRPVSLTLLKGRVRSNANFEPEEGVLVTVSSRTNAFEDRTAFSNNAGRFAMRVPDGDWTVKVTMPSGKVYPVYRITVTGGTIVDSTGQDIPGLMITR